MKKIIITGQQIGLLGGPLYTVYKVLGAVRFAADIDGEAVYWLETNDADFSEINHIDYLDAEGKLKTLTWDIDSRGYSCGLIEVDDALVALLDTFFSTLRQTAFTPVLKEMALACYVPGRTLGEASVSLAEALYGFLDLSFFTPAEKGFREFSHIILLREAGRTEPGRQCNLFCLSGKRREALFKTASGEYSFRDGTIVELEIHDLLPNVKTRNVCQDAYFNAHTYIAGPGEIKYTAELDPEYRFHGVEKAAVKPRMSLTLIEPRVNRLLKKTGLALAEALSLDKAALQQKVLKEKSGFDFKETKQEADALTGAYLEKLKNLGLETKEISGLLRGSVKQAYGKKRAAEKEKHEQLIDSVQYLADNLKPFGKKQERVFNVFYYMNLFGGEEFIQSLYENYDFSRTTLEIER
ncbi:MAG: bacillithiol biosynthesis BshC [Candidatus Aminicenantes bacterium]|nr:bacillithiol biosynthesis BshC [Candidatus Aminicenantes bacterium]